MKIKVNHRDPYAHKLPRIWMGTLYFTLLKAEYDEHVNTVLFDGQFYWRPKGRIHLSKDRSWDYLI